MKIDSKNYDALRHLGIVDLDQGGFKKAERYFKKAISVWSDRHEAYNNLGSLHVRYDNIDEAVKNFNIHTVCKVIPLCLVFLSDSYRRA